MPKLGWNFAEKIETIRIHAYGYILHDTLGYNKCQMYNILN